MNRVLARRLAVAGVLTVATAGVGTALPAGAGGGLRLSEPVVVIPAAPPPVQDSPAYFVGSATSEPRVVVTKTGAVLVSAQVQARNCETGERQDRPEPDCVWRSDDDGRTFQLSGGGEDTGSDVDFAQLPSGVLLYATLANSGLGSGIPGAAVLRSTDDGHTWTSSVFNGDMPLVDREWLTVVDENNVLLTFTAPPGNVFVCRSTDQGRTFGPPQTVTTLPPQVALATPDGPTVDRARGDVVQPYEASDPADPVSADGLSLSNNIELRVARSHDGGTTWTTERVATFSNTQGIAAAAADDIGREYVVYPGLNDIGTPTIWFSRNDTGSAWTSPTPISQPGHSAYLSWVVAAGDGGIAAAWLDTPHADGADAAREWRVTLAVSRDAGRTWRWYDASRHTVYTGAQFDSTAVVFDLFGLALDDRDHVHLVWPRQVDPTASANVTQIEYAGQTDGPGLGR